MGPIFVAILTGVCSIGGGSGTAMAMERSANFSDEVTEAVADLEETFK